MKESVTDKFGNAVEVSCCPNCRSEELDERADCPCCGTVTYRCNNSELLFSVDFSKEEV